MHSILTQAYSPDAFRRMGHALIDQLADYLDGVTTGQTEPVIPYQTPDEAYAFWQADSQQPLTDDPTALFAHILDRSVHLHHPRYMGHQVSPVAPAAALSGLLTELLNNGSAVYEMGMAGNAIERLVTEYTARQIGYVPEPGADAPGGILTSGGTLGNLTALLTARSRLPQDVWHEGNGAARLAIMVSEEAHYCVDRAARIMGLGDAGILKIPTDDRFKLRPELLEETYRQAQQAGLTVFAVVGSGGTTSTGSHDDLRAIGAFASAHELWFHVDAAHGGGAFFSPTYRHLLAGSEAADSVVIDYHKMLLVPALATAVIYKRAGDSQRTFQQRAQYLWSNTTADWHNTGKRTFECTKFMMSVKIYTLMRLYGDALLQANVDTLYDLGRTFANLIRQRPHFELAIEPECNLVCFRYVGRGGSGSVSAAMLSDWNQRIRAAALADGRFYIVQTTLRDQPYLRVSLMNPLTTEADLVAMLVWLEHFAEQLKP